MNDKKAMNRLAAQMKAFESLLQEQETEKAKLPKRETETEDDKDLIADMLMEISGLLTEAADLSAQVVALINGKDIEANCCCPRCCMMEVYFDDEL